MVETGETRGRRREEGESPTARRPSDPMGVRAVEIRERGSERVETNGRDTDGRTTHEENSCTARNSLSVSREGVNTAGKTRLQH